VGGWCYISLMSTRGYIVGVVGIAMVAVSALTAMTTATAAEPAQVGRYSTVESAVAMDATSAYLVQMRGMLVGQNIHDQTDAELIASGRAVCANEIAAGMTWGDLPALTEKWGLSLAFTRAYVASAVGAFCPAALPAMG